MTLPALSDRRRVRLAALVSLYVGQGVPQGLLVVALPAFLAERGVGAAEVGAYLGLVLLPFPLKVLAGPVLDRFTYLPMGRRRPWVLAGGAGVVAAFAAMAAVVDPVGQLGWLVAAGVAANVGVAVLDAAVDGMAIDVLEVEEQPLANALMWGGATLGVAASAVASAALLDAGGVASAASAVAVVLAALLAVPVLVRERPGERLLPWTRGRASAAARARQPADWPTVLGRLRAAVALPASLLLIGVAACAGAVDGLVIAFMPVLAVGELGWDDADYSRVVALGQVAAGLVGMGLGSALIGRVGRVRMLVATALLVAAVLLAMASVPGLWATPATLVAFALGYLVSFVLLTITLFATGMALCGRAVAATQFALFTAVLNVGRSSGSGVLGLLDGALGPSALFAVGAALAVALAGLASQIDVEGHRQRLGEGEGLGLGTGSA